MSTTIHKASRRYSSPMDQPLAQQLLTLELALRAHGLWQGVPPPADAFASQMPFCCDTLSLEQWLQWVLIPRLQALLDAGQDIRLNSDITSYAEEYWQANADHLDLIAILRTLDASLKG